MSELGESREKIRENIGEVKKGDIQEAKLPKLPENNELKKLPDSPFLVDTSLYDNILKKNGLVVETSNVNDADKKIDAVENEKDYFKYLEKRDNGKYYDKETGKEYESVEQWVKAQETQEKRYESTAKYFEDKAKKEWARFKNSEANGESNAEKWEHYRKSQEYYAKARECGEKAKHIREKLGKEKTEYETKSLQQEVINAPLTAKFDAIPIERREIVTNRFQGSPEGIKKVVDSLENVLQVQDSEICENEDGTYTHETSCYEPYENIIFMNPEYDNHEYSEVFTHEYGHFVDAQLGDVSTDFDFAMALESDIDNILSTDAKEQMLDELASADAIFDRSVSDILSGAFMNDEDIMNRYYDEYAPYYSHSNEYWKYGPDNARERETFANLFRIYADSDRADSKAFVEKYFSNTCEQFKAALSI